MICLMSQNCLTKKIEEDLTFIEYLLCTWQCDDDFKQDYLTELLHNQDESIVFIFIFIYKKQGSEKLLEE